MGIGLPFKMFPAVYHNVNMKRKQNMLEHRAYLETVIGMQGYVACKQGPSHRIHRRWIKLILEMREHNRVSSCDFYKNCRQ